MPANAPQRNDTTLPYLSTDAVAQDLDLIRQAVGDEKLSYLGFSYGTLIGSLYAERFPDRIRAMVARWGDGPVTRPRAVPRRTGGGFREGADRFLDDCAARTACAFHEGGKPRGGVRRADGLDRREAAPADARTRSPTGRAGDRLVRRPCGSVLDRHRGRSWRSSLDLAKHGDGSLMLAIADPYQGRKPNGSYSNQHDAYTANTCLDFTAPDRRRDVHGLGEEAGGVAPHFAELIAYNDLACAFWPVPRRTDARDGLGRRRATDRGRRHDRRSGHALRLGEGARQGAGRRRSWSPARAKAIRRTSPDSCVQRAVDEYLLGLTAPKAG